MLLYPLKLECFRYGTNFINYFEDLTNGCEVQDVAGIIGPDNHWLYSSVKSYLLRDGETFLRVAEHRRITEYGRQPGTLDMVVVTSDPNFVPELVKRFDNIEQEIK